MATKLKLIKPVAPTSSVPRPYMSIVTALQLDSVQVEPQRTKRSAQSQADTAMLTASNDGSIPESSRNNTLTSLAGTMRRKGMSGEAIEAALQAENIAHCKPPLDPSEVSAIAASIMRYPAASTGDILKTLTDTGNAARFGVHHANDVKFVFGLGWFIWDGLCWRHDDVDKVVELAKQIAVGIYQEGDVLDEDGREAVWKHAKASQQAPRLKAIQDLAQSLPELAAQVKDMDAKDMLLGVANGVVNLRTGKLQPARREDLLTRHSPVTYDATAKCPTFGSFIRDVTCGDRDLARYVQRAVGYCLTGLANEQCFFFLYGSGRNGKSTFLNVLMELLGTLLARRVQSETLMAKRTGGANNDVARLHNVRVVVANEVEQGTQLAESLIKQMTGSETVAARFLYKETFEFLPKFKLFIAGNHKPVIQGRDEGIWRRIMLIPFVASIPASKCDKSLAVKLRAELPGILNWAIEGCLAWQKRGLDTPRVVVNAVDGYRDEMDLIGQWLADCAKVGPLLEWKAGSVYASYKRWAEDNGYKPMSAGTFGRDLAERFKKVKRSDGNYFLGIGLSP